MLYRTLADLIVFIHFTFILFVIAGGFLVLKWRKLFWIHIPFMCWGVIVEFTGWICPLTPLENHFRRLAGVVVYQGDFIGRYLLTIIYPDDLTRTMQIGLGSIVIITNVVLYVAVIFKYRQDGLRR